MRAVVLGIRFLLELALLGVLAWWGWQAVDGIGGAVLAVAVPLGAATLWGLVVAPRARLDLAPAARVLVEVVLFGLGALALAALTSPAWGVALLVTDLVVIVALASLGRREGTGWSPYDVQQPLRREI